MRQQVFEMLPPPTIGIPTASSPDNSSATEKSEENLESSDDVVITLFRRFDERSMDNSVTMKSIPESSIADDSFYQKINEEDFKIDPVNESDGSVYFKVEAPVFEEEYSNEQLLSYIEQLSSNLKKAEKSVQKQKSRRRSREQAIIKMAKVLNSQKDTVAQLKAKVDELKSEVRMKDTENSVSDQRLQNTLKDLVEAETAIKSLNKRHKHDVTNSGLNEDIESKERAQHATVMKKQQRRALKLAAMVLLCVSSLTAMCALIGCKMTRNEITDGDQQCDMFSSLGAVRQHLISQGVEGQRAHFVKGPTVPAMKQRNLLDVYAGAIRRSTPSSIVQDFVKVKSIT
ncbi:unnamed protein product [Cylindrotheca closterium]|uniref:Uncharacterized protein n=1 Tax=Cylindrotheca closterium TaxID=2856 RepID=A0AAD2CFY1_9STRA|nr:unnamed protein product [Cylindrotheca closterium]